MARKARSGPLRWLRTNMVSMLKKRPTPRLPIAVGHWIHQKGGMLCRLPLKRLRVTAPSEFLRAVQSSCDGKTAWAEVRDRLSARWPADEVDACLSTLLEKGALAEAAHSLALHAQIGWTPQPLAAPLTQAEDLYAMKEEVRRRLEEDSDGASRLRPAKTPLMELLLERGSVRTFDDKALPLQSMINILWALYGVSREDAESVRRTVPSGGALYGLRWFVALMKPLEGHSSGLYEIKYHATGAEGGELSLCQRPGQAAGAWSTLLTPAVLSHAHAVIYPVVDLHFIGKKYGNRALTLALIEAGHALQNGALAAQYEDAATIVRGDTVELEVLSLFGLDEALYPLPAMALGTRPSAEQKHLANAASESVPVRSVPNHSQLLPLQTRIAVAGPIQIGRNADYLGWAAGRSEDARLATVKAEAEAWERIGWSTPPASLQRARFDELDNAVDPRRLVGYSPQQYAREGFPYAPFSLRRRYPWTKGVSAKDGAEVSVMAQCVYALSSLDAADARLPYTNASTSGVAAYTDMQAARCRALIELVERDAFSRAWLARVPPDLIEESDLPVSFRQRLGRLRQAGYTVSLHVLESRHLPVAAIFVQHRQAVFTALTTGAGFQLEESLESALSEAESRVQQQHGKPQPAAQIQPEEMRLAEHHGDYFRTRHGLRKADWFAAAERRPAASVKNAAGRFPNSGTALLDHFLDQGQQVYFCDLTPPAASIDQGRTPLYVARALVPGLIPLWFGYGTEPLGSWGDTAAGKASPEVGSLQRIHPCT